MISKLRRNVLMVSLLLLVSACTTSPNQPPPPPVQVVETCPAPLPLPAEYKKPVPVDYHLRTERLLTDYFKSRPTQTPTQPPATSSPINTK